MNKDNALFATIGVLLGFLAGYLLQEVMVIRQPARLLPGQAAVGRPGAPGGARVRRSGAGPAGPAARRPWPRSSSCATVRRGRTRTTPTPCCSSPISTSRSRTGRGRATSTAATWRLRGRREPPDVLTDLGRRLARARRGSTARSPPCVQRRGRSPGPALAVAVQRGGRAWSTCGGFGEAAGAPRRAPAAAARQPRGRGAGAPRSPSAARRARAVPACCPAVWR